MGMRIGFCLVAAIVLAAGCMEGRLSEEQLAANAADAKVKDAAGKDIADKDALPEVLGDAEEIPDRLADAEPADADILEDSSEDTGADVADEVEDVDAASDTADTESDVDAVTDATDVQDTDTVQDVVDVADTAEVTDVPDTDAGPDLSDSPDAAKCVPADCDDGNACTQDLCDAALGCQHTNKAGSCDDGSACTDGDACSAGTCVAGSPKACTVGYQCIAGTCQSKAPAGMAVIPAGTFWMGCEYGFPCGDTDSPPHRVTLSSYYIDQTEITIGQYQECLATASCSAPGAGCSANDGGIWGKPGYDNHPVNCVTWDQARAFCKWRGADVDLPTEAQWEMAARGDCEKNGSKSSDPACADAMRVYPWGSSTATCAMAVMFTSSDPGGSGCGKTEPWAVGSKPAGASPYGLKDMAGNVREWTRDSWGMYTADAQVDPTTKVDNPAIRVVRGGGYEQTATHLRSTTRGPVAASAGGLSSGLGFRCVKPVGCTTDGDCDDGKACTKDLCQAGACKTSLSPCGLNATCSEPDGKCTCGTGFVGDGQTCKCGPQMVAIDVDGKTVCAPDYPVWGIRPESPPAEWFKDNGDGTVGDTQSKLVWQKEDSGDTKDWAGAKGYCQGLALGSKSDWRLPTRAEVLTLVDFGKAVPVIVPPFVGSLSTPSYFWTSGAFLGAVGQAWAVSTDHGGSYFFPGTTQNRVRCVRSPASESLGDRYTIDAAQGTVHDASTKMTWQRDGGTGGMASWADANGYCQGLQLAGGSWRLPSIVELQSLVNAQLSGTAIDPVVFPSVQTPGATWSSTGVTVGTGDTWIVNFLVGYSGNIKAIVKDVRVRCTRGPVCIADAECDDGNACTVDACKDGACTHTPAGDGLPCGDAMECGAGVCYPKPPQGMALIPAATFWMGCNAVKDKNCADNEKPQHKVTLSAYFMDETETTVGQYKACVDAKVCTAPSYVQPAQYATYPGLTNNPVTMVTWTQSRAYCKWRGAAYDLPTEAQWEMAARGSCEKNGSTAGDAACAAAMRTYPWGEATATCSYAVMKDGDGPNGCGTNATWEVAKKTEGDSPYGLHDMAGNVFEWNRDWYDSYTPGAQTDPSGPGGGADRVGRGGGFGYGAAPLRSGSRYVGFSPSTASGSIGLRCVKSYP